MIPNNIAIHEDGVKFRFSWVGPINALGYLILAGRDPECEYDHRCFFVPCIGADGLSLDMGGGTWFFRIASVLAGDGRGRIRWSNVYGPYTNISAGTKLPPPVGEENFSLLYSHPIQNGLRAHVNYSRSAYIMILEMSQTTLRNSDTEWSYQIDPVRRGSIDILNMTHPNTYTVRCTLIDGCEFPTDRIVQLGVGVKFKGIPEKPIRHFDSASQSLHRADIAVLKQTENEQNLRFSSHADYLRYQAARARAGSKR